MTPQRQIINAILEEAEVRWRNTNTEQKLYLAMTAAMVHAVNELKAAIKETGDDIERAISG